MKMRINSKVFIVITLFILLGCRKDIEDYDRAPSWLKGNAYQSLTSRQNFTMFLHAAELAGYQPLLNGAGLVTVFAPDDAAFRAWLAENSYATIEDAYVQDPERLRILIGYHLVEQSFSVEQLLNFQMTPGNNPGVVQTNAGKCFKFKTYAKDEPSEEYDPASRQNVMVYHREKYLPIISTKLYETDSVVNFENTHRYFFPEVNWLGEDDKLYVCDAAMTEAGIPTDNGYVYTIDKVVDPRRTLYEALQKPTDPSANFTLYFQMMNRFTNYYYDKTISEKFARPGEKYYLLYHNAIPRSRERGVDLPEIASEWAYHGQEDNARPSYNRYLSDNYNCFAFTNDAFRSFAAQHFPQEFAEDISTIPDITLYYLLLAHAYDHQQIILPDHIDKNGVTGQMGEQWNITTGQDIIYSEFCANGILYGMNTVFTPTVFDIITKPLFTSDNYKIMVNMFHISNEFVTIIDREPEHYTLFIQSDTLLSNETYNLRVNYKTSEFGDEVVERIKSDGKTETYNSAQHVQNHIVYGYIKDFTTPAYYGTKTAFDYIFIKNDTIYSEDRVAHSIVGEAGIESVNGITYEINGVFGKNETDIASMLAQSSDFLPFYLKLRDAGLIKVENAKNVMEHLVSGEKYMVFVPDESALQSAPTDSTLLADYLLYYFVPTTKNQLMDYILPGFGTHSNASPLSTLRIDKVLSTPVSPVYSSVYIDQLMKGSEIVRLKNKMDEEIESDGKMPRFASNGVIFKMTSGFTQ